MVGRTLPWCYLQDQGISNDLMFIKSFVINGIGMHGGGYISRANLLYSSDDEYQRNSKFSGLIIFDGDWESIEDPHQFKTPERFDSAFVNLFNTAWH